MNFATWSIRNPIPSIVLFILLSFAGVWGFQRLNVQNFPDFDFPMVIVTLAQPGAAPAQLETEVARKVENSIASLQGLKHQRTSITEGAVSIQVEFVLEKDLSDATIETKDAIDRVRSELPTDLLQPIVNSVMAGGFPIMTYSVFSAEMDEEALSWFVDDTLAKTILSLPGVGKFERIGGVQREINIEVDPVRLAAHGVTASEVSRALRQVEQESSGGRGQLGGAEQSVRTVATVRQASELAALPIALSGGRRVRLDQIATVEDAVAERSQAAFQNGSPVVGFRVYRSRGADETRIADSVEAALTELKTRHPDLSVTLVATSVDYTREQFRGSMDMLYEGAFLAIVVVFLFLRDWRATLIAAAALPLSILPAFAGMALLGFSLNMLTLLALSVIVGILVDDAIVEIENIERHGQMGKPIRRATEDAVNEIALAVIATTMTLVAVFMPTALMSGIPGRFFREFGWTTVIAVLSSLLVARLLTPMMAAYFLKVHPKKDTGDGPIMQRYLTAVRWCLSHRKTTVAGSVLFLVLSFAMLPFIKVGLIPAADRGHVTVDVSLPPGSTLQNTVRISEEARIALKDIQGVESIFTFIGSAPSGGGPASRAGGEVRRSTLSLNMAPRGERRSQNEIEADVRDKLAAIAGARFSFGQEGPGSKMQLILSSDDATALKASAQAFERELRALGKVFNIQSTASLERPEIVVRPDAEKAAERGVTTAAIGETVRVATSGDFDAQVARLNLDNRQVYIRLRIPDAARQDVDMLANLRVAGRNGLVPLSSIASISMESGPSQIDRYDRRRYITVGGDLGGGALGDVLAATEALPSIKNLPANVQVIRTGDTEIASELQSGFGMAIVVGVMCVFGVLVLLFKDFLQPITILSAIPLSIGGVLFAMLVARTELNMPAMIGFVMLMGIVTKNSILLVEYAILGMRERGLSTIEALVDACHKRARPIVMTTVAMSAGMMPLALGFGADAAFRQSMAVAVIGGLLTSTVLSLLVVPVVFVYVDRLEQFLRRTFSRQTHAHAPAE